MVAPASSRRASRTPRRARATPSHNSIRWPASRRPALTPSTHSSGARHARHTSAHDHW